MFGRRFISIFLLVLLGLLAWGGWWTTEWLARRPIPSSGGLYFPGRTIIPVPQFSQGDPRWGEDLLGPTQATLAGEGCAVASAAMVLSSYGIDTDPGRLNAFVTAVPGGYTPEGWIYWEKAAEVDEAFTAKLLPHYEDLPSYALIDNNLLSGNPVIIRMRMPSGMNHFVVICGKEGYDYLIRDPGAGGGQGVYPLRDLTARIEALRFYKKPL